MSAWTDEEVKALISIWGDSKIQEELDGEVRNKAIYTTIAKKMQENGHDRSQRQQWGDRQSTKNVYVF